MFVGVTGQAEDVVTLPEKLCPGFFLIAPVGQFDVSFYVVRCSALNCFTYAFSTEASSANVFEKMPEDRTTAAPMITASLICELGIMVRLSVAYA